jgi:hypothetical protein
MNYPFLICTHGSQTPGKSSNKGPKPSGSLRGLERQNHRQSVGFRFKRTPGTSGSFVPAVSKDGTGGYYHNQRTAERWSGLEFESHWGHRKEVGGGFFGALLRVGRWGVGSAHSGRRWRGRRDSRVCGYGIRRGDGKGCSFPFSFLFLASLFLLPIC